MSFGERFINTLKLIKYPDADKLKSASFDWMVENDYAREFLESFCSNVTEENFVTEEELKEYEAMLADKTIDLGVMEKMADLEEEGISEENVQEQLEDMNADIANTERYIHELEYQRDLINMHKLESAQEAEISENLCKEQQKEIQRIKDENFPSVISELKAVVESGVQVVKGLLDTLSEPLEVIKNQTSGALFLQDLKPYFDSEDELLKMIKNYLDNEVPKFMADATSQKVQQSLEGFIPAISLEESEKQKITEAVRLKKALIQGEEDYVDALLVERKTECQVKFLKDLDEEGGFSVYDIPETQLRARYEKALKVCNELQEEQMLLQEELSKAIREKIQTEVDQVVCMCCKEKSAYYEAYLKILQKPLDALIQQRGRLELINVALSIEKKQMDNTLEKVKSFRKELQAQATDFEKLQASLEEKNKKRPVEPEYVEDGSVLHVANKILSTESDQDLLYLTAGDVYEKIRRSNDEKQKLAEEAENLFKEVTEWISTTEKNKDILDSYFYGKKSKDPTHPVNILEELNSKLNRLGARIQDLEEKLFKEMTRYQKKKKLINRNSDLEKARKLFVYAVNDKQKYMQCIQEIKAQTHYMSSI